MVRGMIRDCRDVPQALRDEEQDFLVSCVSEKWDKWDELRRSNLEIADIVEKTVYPSKKGKLDKNSLEIPEIYEVKETYKSHLWKSWFSSLDTMFDVQGKSKSDHFMANQQKASLIDVFRDINLALKFEKGLDNWITKGEFIAFINWNTKTRQVRRKEYVQPANFSLLNQGLNCDNENYSELSENFAFAENNEDGQSFLWTESSAEFVIKDEIVYDGPDLTIVSPEAFVFDPDKKEDFDSCPKIYRSWATYDEISSNKLYQNYKGLQEIVGKKDSSKTNKKAVRGDQLEVLEYWGDIKLKNGTILRNYVLTIAGREKVIRFEPNPFIINPFVFASFLEDPETKRGISPLYVAVPLNQISSTILNLQVDALRLIINKPYLAPKGSLSGKISIKEGSIIEYDPALMPREPVPLDFKDALVGWDFLKFFETKIESATGVFKYMSGDSGVSKNRTATEATGLMIGQNVRLSKEVDVLNFKVKIPVIQKIAELLANFSFEVKEIKVFKPNGDIDFIPIDGIVRQGSYEYIIGDNTAIQERKAKLSDNLKLFYEFSNLPDVSQRIKWIEVLKWSFEQLGVADPNMFIKDDI